MKKNRNCKGKKSFWKILISTLVIASATIGSAFSITQYNNFNQTKTTSLLNQSSFVPSDADQSYFLQQSIKNNKLINNSNAPYFNVKYNNQNIYSGSLDDLGAPYSIFFDSQSFEKQIDNLKDNILLNLRRQGDLQNSLLNQLNDSLNLPGVGTKYDVYEIKGIYPKLPIYEVKKNYYAIKGNKLGDINLGWAKTPQDINNYSLWNTSTGSTLAILGSFFDKFANVAGYVPTFKVEGQWIPPKYNVPNLVGLLNNRLKQFNLYKPSNKLQEYWSNLRIASVNPNWYGGDSRLKDDFIVGPWDMSYASNGIWASTNSIDDASYFVDLGPKIASSEISSLTNLDKIFHPLIHAIPAHQALAIKPKNRNDSKYFILDTGYYGAHNENSLANKFFNSRLKLKESLLPSFKQIYLIDPKTEKLKFKNLNLKSTKVLNNSLELKKTNLSSDDILLPNNLSIAKINFTSSPHFYKNFLTFLSKQIVIDPDSGIFIKSNPNDNGVYSNPNNTNLKFSFNSDFAYLINQMNTYNYFLHNVKESKLTDPNVKTFQSIINNVSKASGDDGIYKTDLIFLNNFYNLKYDASTINKLLDARSNALNSNDYFLNVWQTTNQISTAFSKVFANPEKAILGKLYDNKNFVNEEAKDTFDALMDLPTLLNQVLFNKKITADVNYGVPGKNINISIWSNNKFQPIPQLPKLSDANQNVLYMSSINTQNNITQISINNLQFDNSVLTGDDKNVNNSILKNAINEFEEKHPCQDTLEVVNDNNQNTVIQYTIKFRADYKNFSFTVKNSLKFNLPINNGVPVMDTDAGFHRDWLATQYELNFMSTQAQNSINNYFGKIDPTYLKNGGFVLYSTFGIDEVLNDKHNQFFSTNLQNKLSSIIKKYNLETKPNDSTGSFYRIVRLNNANDLGNQQRADHPAPYVWYIGDVANNPANSYYLMKFEAPNKIYDLANLEFDSNSKELYIDNKSHAFVEYSKKFGNEIKQDQKLFFKLANNPVIKKIDNYEFLDVNLEKPLGVQFSNLIDNPLPATIAKNLVSIFAKDYLFNSKVSQVKQIDRDTLNFQIGLSKKSNIDIANKNNVNSNKPLSFNLLNQSFTVPKDAYILGKPQDDPNFPKMMPDWNGVISFPIQFNDYGTSEWWFLPYKVSVLSNNKKHVELLWKESPQQHNFTLTFFSTDRDKWLEYLLSILEETFFNPKTDFNGNNINYSFNSNIKDSLVVQSDSQTTNPWFDINISSSLNSTSDTTGTNSSSNESKNLSVEAQAGIGIGIAVVFIASLSVIIVIHRRKNRKLLDKVKRS